MRRVSLRRVWGSGFSLSSLGFRVWDLGALGCGFKIRRDGSSSATGLQCFLDMGFIGFLGKLKYGSVRCKALDLIKP